jgi:DNA polymerase-3 subunit delta'
MIPAMRLINAYRDMISTRQECEQPVNPRLFLEGLFLDYRALFTS